MNLSKTEGQDLTFGGNYLSRANFSNTEGTSWKIKDSARTNSWVIAIAVTLFLIFMVMIVYLGWLWYVRDFEEDPRSFYEWLY